MLKRHYADLRHAPQLDPQILAYDPLALPQAVVRLGPACRRRIKGGVVIAEPGWTGAFFLYPGRWYAVMVVSDTEGALAAYHVDLCTPLEERDGMLSFVDLKLDLVMLPDRTARWVDWEDYHAEVRAGTISASWQATVHDTMTALDRACAAGEFPPPEVRAFRWPSSPSSGSA